MTELQKKAVNHVIELVNDVDTGKLYSKISDIIASTAQPQAHKNVEILSLIQAHDTELKKETQNIKWWLKSIADD